MKQFICVWNNADDSSFEKHAPLLFNGERNRKLGSTAEFEVLFLDGLNLLSREYQDRLRSLGYHLHDMEDYYRQLRKRFRSTEQFGDYEQKCFLRWLAILKFQGAKPFVHYDADVVFNSTPEAIDAEFAGLTFMLQGCPAYTRVEDGSWLTTYEAELELFVSDVAGYSGEAWRQRLRFEPEIRERNGALWCRQILSSDQDLLQFLTLSGRLPQADSDTVNRATSLALFQNPLVIGSDIQLALPLRYERRDGIDFMSDRKVAFWHMQGDFCNYLGYAAFRRMARDKGRIPRIGPDRPFAELAYRAARRISPAYSRSGLIRRYFGDNAKDLSFLFNGKSFWDEGVFV